MFCIIQGIPSSNALRGLSRAACALAPAFLASERLLVAANTVPNTPLYNFFNPPFNLGPISLVRLLIILEAKPPDNPVSLSVTRPIFFFDSCFAAPVNEDNLSPPTIPWISSTNPPTWSFISLIVEVDSLLARLITLPITGWVDLNFSTSSNLSFNFLTNFSGSWTGNAWALEDCSPTSVFKKYEPSFLILEVYPVKGAKGIL